jgi:hypothetical protein
MNGSDQSNAQPQTKSLLKSLIRINANKGHAVLHLSCGTDLSRVFVQAGEVVHVDGVKVLFMDDLDSPTGRLDHDIGALIGSGVPANEAMSRAAKAIGKFLVEMGANPDCDWGLKGGENSPDSVIPLPVGLGDILMNAWAVSPLEHSSSLNLEESTDRLVRVCDKAEVPAGLPPLSFRAYRSLGSRECTLLEVLNKISTGSGGLFEARKAAALLFALGLIEFTGQSSSPNQKAATKSIDDNSSTEKLDEFGGWTVESLDSAERAYSRQHPFQIFGLVCDETSRKITTYDVRSAFRKVAADFHPDRFSGASDELKQAAQRVFTFLNHSRSKIESQEDLDLTISRFMPKKSERGVVTEIDRTKAKGNVRSAEARMRHGKWDEARQLILLAMEQVPEDKRCQILEIFCRGVMKDIPYAEAATSIEEVETESARQHAEKFYRSGWLYKLGGNNKNARDRFSKSLIHDPNHVDSSRELRMLEKRSEAAASTRRKQETRLPFSRFFNKK